MNKPYPPVTIHNSQHIPFPSEAMGRDYSIYVLLPDGYESSDHRYPVVYTLDAQWDFTLLAGMVGGLMAEMLMPRAMVVGVTWPGEDADYDALRVADFATPSVPGQPGGTENFLKLFREELIPFVDANYRTEPADRTFMGGSLAGYFVLYAMLKNTELFQRYVSVGPALFWGDEVLFQLEAAYAQEHQDLPVHLFLAVGEWEHSVRMVAPLQRFSGILASRRYKGLKLDTMIVKEELHSSIKGEAYSRGLRAVFAREVVEVAPELLPPYVGSYRATLNGDLVFNFTITQEGDRLFGQSMHGEPPSELFAESPTRFFSRRHPIAITFHPDEEGVVQSATFHFEDGDAPAERVGNDTARD